MCSVLQFNQCCMVPSDRVPTRSRRPYEESLLIWWHSCCRAKPSLPMVLAALLDVTEHLRELHACGYVYYAVKPSNIVWLQAEGAWHLSDFGCASRSGAPHTHASVPYLHLLKL